MGRPPAIPSAVNAESSGADRGRDPEAVVSAVASLRRSEAVAPSRRKAWSVAVVGTPCVCPAGHPCVATNFPLQTQRGKVEPHPTKLVPFPTLHWLCCPTLVRAVARLESAGIIASLDAELITRDDWQASLRAAHERCIAERWALLNEAQQRAVADAGLMAFFDKRGLGGMRCYSAVKCLHLHVADFLVAGINPIGQAVWERYDLRLCPAVSGR